MTPLRSGSYVHTPWYLTLPLVPKPTALILLILMRSILAFAISSLLLTTAGCHSPYIEATVSNHTPQAIELLEVDYPSASFGTQNLVPGADFHYRFKVLGEGSTKLLYTDNAHHDHKSDGPTLKEGAEGRLTIVITPTNVTWQSTPAVVSRPH